jgi:hypothetical protein
VIALAPHLAKIGYLPIGKTLGVGLRPVQQSGDPGGRKQSVVLSFERRELLAAHVGASARHHYSGVPAQEG